jgi:membrane glycosyltransferase
MLIGVVWGAAIWWLAPFTFWWFVPVLAGMVLAIPLSVFTSRSAWGERARVGGLFLTPEETSPPPQLDTLRLRMAAITEEEKANPATSELAEIVLDPYSNAIHVSLLRENKLNPDYAGALAKLGAGAPAVGVLGEKLLTQGVEALKPAEKMLIMCDADVMSWLHRQVWLRSRKGVAASWRTAIQRYAS